MGVVFRAHDERLQRDVAVKVLPAGALANETARRRFRKEALALSRLNHPNIATVHDFDTEAETDFLVTEYIPGIGLDEMLAAGPLAEKEIVSLGSQLAQGLAAAHDQGVIHRDLKPANLRVTPDGRLKILDFGLAHVLPPTVPDEATASLTQTQVLAGTAPYMAPEQLVGGRLDARTDLWAAGVVLYEMATGRRPFAGSGPKLTEAILHADPEPPRAVNNKVSEGVQAIILKCLEKEPEERYVSAREVALDLQRLGTAAVGRPIAFEEQARLVNTRSVDPEAHRLYLLGRYYWNKRTAKDLRTAIDYFGKTIAQDPFYAPAYAGLADCYAVMVAHSNARPSEVFPKAAAAATKALEIDDTLAGPHAALGWTKDLYEQDWTGAEREYKRALELNPNYATAHQWYALHFAFLGRIEEAITEIRRAQELDPLSLITAANLGQLLYFARRYDEAIEQLRKVLDMDANFVQARYVLGAVYEQQGRYEEAIAERRRAAELSGGAAMRLASLGKAYAQAGKRAEALKILKQLKEQSKRDYISPSSIAVIYLGLGDKDQAFAWWQRACAEQFLPFFLKVDPNFDPLRSDPRFQELLRCMGLSP